MDNIPLQQEFHDTNRNVRVSLDYRNYKDILFKTDKLLRMKRQLSFPAALPHQKSNF